MSLNKDQLLNFHKKSDFRPRIVFVLGDISGHGGTERVTTEIASSLSSIGYKVEIHSVFVRGSPYFPLPDSVKLSFPDRTEFRSVFDKYFTVSSYLKFISSNTSDQVVVLVDTILFVYCLPFVWFCKSDIVCWEHFNLTTNHNSRFRSLARVAASRLSDYVVVLTKRDELAWRKKYLISNRIKTISNPIPHFHEKAVSYCPSGNLPRTLLAVGRLSHEKGFDLLLHAWQLLGSVREGWQLRIVGSGIDELQLKSLAKFLDVDSSVVFVGQIDDVAREYRCATLYVMSSRWEGLPMTLLEAQYFGLPSVSTDCLTGPREVLAGGSGLLVKPESSEALAEGLSNLMTNPVKRATMAQLARDNAKRYSHEAVLREWEELFSSLGYDGFTPVR